jgi:hypothetical protein
VDKSNDLNLNIDRQKRKRFCDGSCCHTGFYFKHDLGPATGVRCGRVLSGQKILKKGREPCQDGGL